MLGLVRVSKRDVAIDYDVKLYSADGGWRDDFAWPVSLPDVDAILTACGRAMACMPAMVGEGLSRDAARLNLLSASVAGASILEAALEVSGLARIGRQFVHAPILYDYLAGRTTLNELPVQVAHHAPSSIGRGGGVALRAARNAKATWALKGPLGFLHSPWTDITVISRNPELDMQVSLTAHQVRFVGHSSYLRNLSATKDDVLVPKGIVDELSAAVATIWSDVPELGEEMMSRVRLLVVRDARCSFLRAAQDLLRLRRVRRVPKTIWSGSGASYASRLLGLEVMRRGGRAVRFGHGGETSVFRAEANTWVRRELQVSNEFVLPTQLFSEIVNRESGVRDFPGMEGIKVTGGAGDPSLALPRTESRHTGKRLKVLYVPSIYRGARTYLSNVPRAPQYLDWQFSLLGVLSRLPIDLFCKPHPRDARAGDSPLSGLAGPVYQPFESVGGNFDVLILDHLNSTALAMALASRKHVGFVSLVDTPLLNVVQREFSQRCRVVKATHRESGRIEVDPETLEDAVRCNRPSDSSFFRRLFLPQAMAS